MHRFACALLVVLILSGCDTTDSRIARHSSEFAALDGRTQHAIKEGVVEPGFTPDMVYMARGKPDATSTGADGATVWTYRVQPVTAYNETIQAGFRRRVVYDPTKRGDDIIVERIDPKAFPNLLPHTVRITFRQGRVVEIVRTSD